MRVEDGGWLLVRPQEDYSEGVKTVVKIARCKILGILESGGEVGSES